MKIIYLGVAAATMEYLFMFKYKTKWDYGKWTTEHPH